MLLAAFILLNGLEIYWKARTLHELKFAVKINIIEVMIIIKVKREKGRKSYAKKFHFRDRLHFNTKRLLNLSVTSIYLFCLKNNLTARWKSLCALLHLLTAEFYFTLTLHYTLSCHCRSWQVDNLDNLRQAGFVLVLSYFKVITLLYQPRHSNE